MNEKLNIFKSDYPKMLIKSPIFNGFMEEEMREVLGCFTPVINKYKKGEYIVKMGDECNKIGIMLSGSDVITKESITGNRTIVATLVPVDVFGEVAAFSDNKIWPSSVVASEQTDVLFITIDKIIGYCDRICDVHRKIILNLLKIISNKALMLNKKVEYMTISTIRKKIAVYLLEQYKKTGSLMFTLKMNRNELADFLNVTRPSLSREMAILKSEGIISYYKSSIKIADINALKRLTNE